MYPRCDNASATRRADRTGGKPPADALKAHVGILVAIAFALAACGSNPSPDPVTSSAPTAKQRAGKTPSESAPQAMPVEEPLPPEAVQKFDTAVVRMNAGDGAAAEQAFRTIAAEYPKYSGALVNLGILQANQGRLEDAEKSFQAALQRNASNAATLNQLGIVYRKLGRFQDADQSYQRAVQADSNYANAYLNLGVLCDLYLQQPERALEAYERYLEVASSPDERVKTWVTELRKRLGAEPRAARSE